MSPRAVAGRSRRASIHTPRGLQPKPCLGGPSPEQAPTGQERPRPEARRAARGPGKTEMGYSPPPGAPVDIFRGSRAQGGPGRAAQPASNMLEETAHGARVVSGQDDLVHRDDVVCPCPCDYCGEPRLQTWDNLARAWHSRSCPWWVRYGSPKTRPWRRQR